MSKEYGSLGKSIEQKEKFDLDEVLKKDFLKIKEVVLSAIKKTLQDEERLEKVVSNKKITASKEDYLKYLQEAIQRVEDTEVTIKKIPRDENWYWRSWIYNHSDRSLVINSHYVDEKWSEKKIDEMHYAFKSDKIRSTMLHELYHASWLESLWHNALLLNKINSNQTQKNINFIAFIDSSIDDWLESLESEDSKYLKSMKLFMDYLVSPHEMYVRIRQFEFYLQNNYSDFTLESVKKIMDHYEENWREYWNIYPGFIRNLLVLFRGQEELLIKFQKDLVSNELDNNFENVV